MLPHTKIITLIHPRPLEMIPYPVSISFTAPMEQIIEHVIIWPYRGLYALHFYKAIQNWCTLYGKTWWWFSESEWQTNHSTSPQTLNLLPLRPCPANTITIPYMSLEISCLTGAVFIPSLAISCNVLMHISCLFLTHLFLTKQNLKPYQARMYGTPSPHTLKLRHSNKPKAKKTKQYKNIEFISDG